MLVTHALAHLLPSIGRSLPSNVAAHPLVGFSTLGESQVPVENNCGFVCFFIIVSTLHPHIQIRSQQIDAITC